MKTVLLAATVVAGVAIGAGAPASAAVITYNFFANPTGTNTDLGATATFTSGGITITATAGQYGGTAPAGNGDSFSTSSSTHLVNNNRGTDEQGLGVCVGNGNGPMMCGTGGQNPLQNNGEIDFSNREVVQLDIQNLFNAFGTNFAINADSTTQGELLGVWNSASVSNIGNKLVDINQGTANVSVSPTGRYLYFISDSSNGGGDVLLHSLTVTTPNAVPEPVSLALLGAGLLGTGVMRRRARR